MKACTHQINGVRHPKPRSFRQNHTPSFWSSQVVHEVNKGPSWPESSEQKFVIVCLYAVIAVGIIVKVYLVVKVLTV